MKYDRKHNEAWTEISDHKESRTVFMKGAIVVDGYGTVKPKLVSNILGNMHVPIIKWGAKLSDCQALFRALSTRRSDIGATSFYQAGNGIYSVSFRILNWSDYRRLLFSAGVDKAFRSRTLSAMHGYMPLVPKVREIGYFGSNKYLDSGLKESVLAVI